MERIREYSTAQARSRKRSAGVVNDTMARCITMGVLRKRNSLGYECILRC